MRKDPALCIEIEDEEPRKGLLGVDPAGQAQRGQRDAGALVLVVLFLDLALLAPAHDELLLDGAGAAGQEGQGLRGHALGEDLELDVADDGDAVPGDGGGPKGGVVGDSAGDDGEMRVRGGEELERDVGGEDVLREGRL